MCNLTLSDNKDFKIMMSMIIIIINNNNNKSHRNFYSLGQKKL